MSEYFAGIKNLRKELREDGEVFLGSLTAFASHVKRELRESSKTLFPRLNGI
jgi:hypothetical protein